jgi:uncharacterized protein (DUF1697 family)
MKMEKLRASCETLGLRQVKTYIQSGNIVFQSPKLPPEAIARELEEQIAMSFGFSSDVIIRTKDDLEQVVQRNPLLKERGIDQSKLHVVFCSEPPTRDSVKKLESLTLAPDNIRHSGREIYFYFPNGVSRSSVRKHPLDRILGVSMTMRNWKTVNTLYEMALACG